MKQLIVLAAVLPLLMIFMMQATLDQKNSWQIGLFQQEVAVAREQAKQAGCFTPEIQNRLRARLFEQLAVPPAETEIEATDTVQYRLNYFDSVSQRGLINYRVSIPIQRIMAGNRLFGIAPAENSGRYTIAGCTASEKLPEAANEP